MFSHGSYEFVDWCGANTVGGNNTWSGHEHRNILIGSFNLSFLLMPFIFKVFFTLVSSCLQKKTKWNESLQSLFQCLWYLPFLSLFKFIGNVNMLREAKDLYRKVVRISYKMTDVADNCENMEELDALLGLTKDEKEVLKGAIEAENIELGYVGTKTDALTWTQRFKSLFRIEKDPNASNGQDQPDGDMKNQVKGKTSDQPKSKEKPAQTKNARTRTVSECPANKEKQKKEIDTEKKRRRINGYSAIQKEQEKAEKYISHLQSKVQAFNIYKAVLEDLPQTVMQLSVLANEGRIDGQLKTIISTIVLNMASTIIYFSRAYLMMPFQVDEKSKLNCPVQKPKESNQRRNRKSSIEMDELNSKQPDKKARDNGQNAKTEDPDPSKGAKRRRLKSESAENKKIEKHEKDPEQTQKMEKAPYKSIFNFPIVIICMIFIVTPRLLMVALWTSNRDLDLMPIPLIILGKNILKYCILFLCNSR